MGVPGGGGNSVGVPEVSRQRPPQPISRPQEALMDHALQTISYIADIGPVLVLMARRRLARSTRPQERERRLYKMLCHVFHAEDVSGGCFPAGSTRGSVGQAWDTVVPDTVAPHTARRLSSLHRPSARPSPWPTASSCGRMALTPARWAPGPGPPAPATCTMGTWTISPTVRTAGR